MKTPTMVYRAFLLLASVRSALKNNVRHFSPDAAPLLTEKEILLAIYADSMFVDESEAVKVTSVEKELRLISEDSWKRFLSEEETVP